MKHLQTTLPAEVPLDAALTGRYRAYAPPGGGTSNSEVCCYSYCVAGLIKSVPPKAAGRSLCFDAPEGGTSQPAEAPYAECAKGLIVGGEQAAFSASDTKRTRESDNAGPWVEKDHACCYFMDMGFLGRPFRPARSERPRVAAAVESDAWALQVRELDLESLAPEIREALAQRRAADAALEHASVASFAHVSLQLLALGAPAELVRASHQAALDEVEHARAMYGLASAYRGAPCGPGPLDVSAAKGFDSTSDRAGALAAFAMATLDDACVAETAGAVIARQCAEAAESPALRSLLKRIADDEARHAALGWQMLAWAVREGGERAANSVRERLQSLCDAPQQPDDASAVGREAALPQHGLLPRAEEARILRATLCDVVVPCAAALSV
ncbi:MAG TPA: ferritin-like domain-containing protein [Polyangiaceae bacterium]|nr:ferritin-like domain-containing protein [Polyangiaceae bacterium]